MRFTGLLLLLVFCTCVRAQSRMPATLVVEVGNDHYVVAESSPYQYQLHRFVSRTSQRRDNNRFRGYKWVDMRNRYDLRAVNRLRDSLHRAGWILEATNHTISQQNYDTRTDFRELFVYTYTVPTEPDPRIPLLKEELANYELVRTASGPSVDGTFQLRTDLVRERSTRMQTLIIFQENHTGPKLLSRIDNVQLLTDRADFELVDVEISGLYLKLTYRDGRDTTSYLFKQADDRQYYLVKPTDGTAGPTSLANFRPRPQS